MEITRFSYFGLQTPTLIGVRIIIFWDFRHVSRCDQGLLATSTSDTVSMDTTISGGVFLNLPEILSIVASADRKDRRPKPRSNLPAPAPLAGQARATPRLPSCSFRPWAPLGSARLSSAALASSSAVSGAIAASCGDAPRAGCRCRTGRRLRGRPSGAPQLAEGRRAASGTDGERRRARRQPQVRKARALEGWVPLGSGPHTSGDPCPHRHGAHGCARG